CVQSVDGRALPAAEGTVEEALNEALSPDKAAASEGAAFDPALDEASLIRAVQRGDRDAFERLVRSYDKDVLRLAMNLTRSAEDARDIYQEAFLRAYRNIASFRFECSFYTWIYRIVTNICLDHLRRRKARPEDQSPELNSGVHEEGITDFFERQREHRPTLDPERTFIGKEIKARIATAMERLSP